MLVIPGWVLVTSLVANVVLVAESMLRRRQRITMEEIQSAHADLKKTYDALIEFRTLKTPEDLERWVFDHRQDYWRK